jgi:hypothetical protein
MNANQIQIPRGGYVRDPDGFLVLRAINFVLCAMDHMGRWCENLSQGHAFTYADGMALVKIHRCLLAKARPLQLQLQPLQEDTV